MEKIRQDKTTTINNTQKALFGVGGGAWLGVVGCEGGGSTAKMTTPKHLPWSSPPPPYLPPKSITSYGGCGTSTPSHAKHAQQPPVSH